VQALRLILSTPRYFAVAWVFATLNILTGTWVLYIPQVRQQLELSDAALGLVLFCFPVGVLLALPFVPRISRQIGLGRFTYYGAMLLPIWYVLMVGVDSVVELGSLLFFAGMVSGSVDVAMNALVSNIEETDQVKIMSTAHGFFSLGGVIGASVGALLMDVIQVPTTHLLLILVVLLLTNGWLARYYKDMHELTSHTTGGEKAGLSTLLPLAGIAAVAMMVMMNEGAIEHWSKLYLLEVVKVTNEGIAAAGFIAFSALMTTGRFLGDAAQTRLGSSTLLLGGMLMAVAGHGLILSTHLAATVAGFGVLGLGLSVVIPELFRLAGQYKGVPASVSISFVSGIGFVGFLLGPVVLGFISEAAGLVMSFAFLLALIALSILLVVGQRAAT